MLYPSSFVSLSVHPATPSIRVGYQSLMSINSRLTVPFILSERSGLVTKPTARTPPSHKVVLDPRRGQLLAPWSMLPPLSEEKKNKIGLYTVNVYSNCSSTKRFSRKKLKGNSLGPRTLPCGTPEGRWIQGEVESWTEKNTVEKTFICYKTQKHGAAPGASQHDGHNCAHIRSHHYYYCH